MPRNSLEKYRSTLVKVLRSICHLPSRAATSYLFDHRSAGGLGFLDPFLKRHVQTIAHTMKILSSPDKTIHNIAHKQLQSVVYRCFHRQPSKEELDAFLSGLSEGPLNEFSKTNKSSTLWSRFRQACRALKLHISDSNHEILITADNITYTKAKNASSFLHKHITNHHATKLKELPDQGKVARCINESNIPSVNSRMFNETGLRFWSFIHRARTNTLPTNAAKHRWNSTNNATCRRCHSDSSKETLPHIISHCHPNMSRITTRHNLILNRLKDNIKHGTISIDKTIPDDPNKSRPDIVIYDGNRVHIIDITCPFENDSNAFKEAADKKQEKYNYLIEFFAKQHLQASISAFVVGFLGAWYDQNEKDLQEIRMPMRFRTLFRKLCAADCKSFKKHLCRTPYWNQAIIVLLH